MYVEYQKRRMLIRVFELLQSEDFRDLYACFPSVKGWFKQDLVDSGKFQKSQQYVRHTLTSYSQLDSGSPARSIF
jgi:hypothetical protein